MSIWVRMVLGAAAALGLLAAGAAAFVAANQYRPPQDALTFTDAPAKPVLDDASWTTPSGDPAQLRHTDLDQLTPDNVGHLAEVWRYSTGEATRRGAAIRRSKFQATPIVAAGALVLCTPFNRVIALDPLTGREVWTHDPEIDPNARVFNEFNCRGVAQWSAADAAERAGVCGVRILTATNDRRLIALDARTGARCANFGVGGAVEVVPAAEQNFTGEVQIVAAPAVIGDMVVVGSSVADNQVAKAASGAVRAFDVRTGAPVWRFDALAQTEGSKAGGANVWSAISVDEARGLVFLPTSSPSPDFFGGERGPDSPLTNAMVAVRAADGEVVWSFQTVRHDLWDYDVPAAPTLFELERDGVRVPALAFATKQGFVFVLHRETGAPLFDVIDKPAPPSDVPGERAAPTQPHSTLPAIAPQRIEPKDAFGVVGFDQAWCAAELRKRRNDGLFTPPSLEGSVLAPTTGGGANWGGVTIDPDRGLLVVNTNRAAEIITLLPRQGTETMAANERVGVQPQAGTPYATTRGVLLSPLGLPCNRPPWGALTAIDLRSGALAWEKPLGTTSTLAPLGLAFPWGTPNLGGPMTTAGGLTFIAAAMDNRLRAFETATGRALWSAELPAGGQATPMSFAAGGRQYVVIAAGGHSILGTTPGDTVLAFALPAERIAPRP